MKAIFFLKTIGLLFVASLLLQNCSKKVNPNNALESYINNKDKSYEWES